jgi:hypothetical protein
MLETVIADASVLVAVIVRVLLLPTTTLPKSRLELLSARLLCTRD